MTTETYLIDDASLFHDLTLKVTASFGPADPDVGRPSRAGLAIESVSIVRGKHNVPFDVNLLTEDELARLERYVWEQREGEA